MKKNLLFVSLLFQVIISTAQRFEWLSTSKQANSNSNIPVATDAEGNVYTLIDNGPLDCIIQGDTIHQVVVGTTGCIAVKFGRTGNFIWGKRIDPDGGGIYGGMIAVDKAGSVYVSANFPNGGHINLEDTIFPTVTGSGNIVKLSSSGNSMRTISFPFTGAAPAISCLGTDLYIAVGTHVDKLDSAFNTVWSIKDPSNTLLFERTGNSKADIFTQTNGQLVVSAWEFGNTIGVIPFGNDSIRFHLGGLDEGAIIKLDTSGQVLWTRVFPCNDFNPAIRAVCLDVQGNAYLGLEGFTFNAKTIFGNDTLVNTLGTGNYCAILKWDNTGKPVRAIGLYPIASPPDLMDLAVNGQSELLVSGMIGTSQMYIDANDSIVGYGNFYLIKYDSAGVYKWYKTEAHNVSTFVDGIAVRNGNEYVLGGSTGSGSNYQFDCIPDPTTQPTNWVTVISELPVIYPSASFTYMSNDSIYSFTDQSQNATSWHWDFGDGDTSNAPSPTHTFTLGGNFEVVLTAYHYACSSTSTLHITGVGINEITSTESFLMFPNPSTGNFIITSNNFTHTVSVEIFDIVGKKVFENYFDPSLRIEINSENIQDGIYIAKIRYGDSQAKEKLIVTKD